MHNKIDVYLSHLRSIHPNLYAHYDASQFDALAQELKEQTNEPMLASQFRWVLARFNGLTDGHTNVFTNNRRRQRFFPWITSQDGQVFLGDYILVDIGGIDAYKIYNEVAAFVSWETNPANKLRSVNANFFPYIRDFYRQKAPFNCSLLCPKTGVYKTTKVRYISIEDWRINANPSFNPLHHSDRVNFKICEEESIAVLFYNTSHISERDTPLFVREVRRFFDEVEKNDIQTIFIDVSQNGGGSDGMHSYIYRHLRWEPFVLEITMTASEAGASIFAQLWNSVKENSDMHSCAIMEQEMEEQHKFQSRYMRGVGFDEIPENLQKRGIAPTRIEMERKDSGFDGNVFVIMGSGTYSAADTFCLYMALGQRATLVGEASGQRNPFSGNASTTVVMGSKIAFRVPSTHTLFNNLPPSVNLENGFLQPCIPYPLTKPLELEDYKRIIEMAREKGR
jgi:hypothetical protein